ncbi:ATP-binding protein [Streptomyces sp. NPDC006640]|uniref:ATP-binding protein n=1 Tax=unclassified Streptomyces TaxID=2593676 RepID=UPI003697FACB
MSADDVNPVALLSASLRLTAVPAAVAMSRRFVRYHLPRWKMEEHTDAAALIASELVTNAVKVSGVLQFNPKPWQITGEHVIAVQLRAIGSGLYVEVWDRIESSPVVKHPSLSATNGRGLLLVEQFAMTWNVYRPRVGGKVVWAQLPLEREVEPPAFEEPFIPLQVPSALRSLPGATDDRARTALYERLLETTAAAMRARVNDAT